MSSLSSGIASPGQAIAKPAGAAKGDAAQGAQLTRVEARQSVNVTGKDGQRAEGEWADFDVKANTIVMGGHVVVTQGRNIVRGAEGSRLLIDMTTGEVLLEANAMFDAVAYNRILDAGILSCELIFPQRADVDVVISETLRKDAVKTRGQ